MGQCPANKTRGLKVILQSDITQRDRNIRWIAEQYKALTATYPGFESQQQKIFPRPKERG